MHGNLFTVPGVSTTLDSRSNDLTTWQPVESLSDTWVKDTATPLPPPPPPPPPLPALVLALWTFRLRHLHRHWQRMMENSGNMPVGLHGMVPVPADGSASLPRLAWLERTITMPNLTKSRCRSEKECLVVRPSRAPAAPKARKQTRGSAMLRIPLVTLGICSGVRWTVGQTLTARKG